jgi:methionyl-tRNA formyltransferase
MRVLMMGTGTFAEPTFRALLSSRHTVAGLVTNPDRPSGKHQEMERGMKKIALEHNLPVFQPDSANTPESIEHIRTYSADIFVVAAYGQILSSDLLRVPPKGGINVHASLLPKYRGAAPINWAIYHGETETGVTIIRISPRMDAGEMLAQGKEPIHPDDTTGTLQPRLADLGARLALQVLDQIDAGTEQGIPQDITQVTKAPKLKKELGLIDFTKPADQIARHVRAFQPWPTAYTHWRRPTGEPLRVIILKAEPLPERTTAPPGQVVKAAGDHLALAAGDGTVVNLATLQPSGKKALTAREFLRGYRVQPGDLFG